MNILGDAVSRRAMLEANQATANTFRRAADGVNAAEAVLALGMLPTISHVWQSGQRRASARSAGRKSGTGESGAAGSGSARTTESKGRPTPARDGRQERVSLFRKIGRFLLRSG